MWTRSMLTWRRSVPACAIQRAVRLAASLAANQNQRTRPRPAVASLVNRRKRRREHDRVLLLLNEAGRALRRPDTALDRELAEPVTFIEARIGPDMHELLQRTADRVHRCHDRRELDPIGNRRLPRIDSRTESVGLQDVAAQ